MGYPTTGGAIESMVNPTSSYNLTMQWAAEAREARDRAEREARKAASRKIRCMSSAEKDEIYNPAYFAMQKRLHEHREKSWQEFERKQFSLAKLVSSWFSSR